MRISPSLAALALVAAGTPALAQQGQPATQPGQLILFQQKSYAGRSQIIIDERRATRIDWNVGSIAVHPGERWEVCNRARFGDPCMTVTRSIPDTQAIGAYGVIGSARPLPAQ
jgi:hypothetical protein